MVYRLSRVYHGDAARHQQLAVSFRPGRAGEERRFWAAIWCGSEIVEEIPDIADQRRELIALVNEEDARATTELAKSMRSRKAARGPLSHFEGTVAQFNKYLARTLAADRAPLRATAAE